MEWVIGLYLQYSLFRYICKNRKGLSSISELEFCMCAVCSDWTTGNQSESTVLLYGKAN